MKVLENNELERISGGFSAWVAVGIASAFLFVAEVFKGFVHPNSCD